MIYTPAKETIARYEAKKSKPWVAKWLAIYNALQKAKHKSELFGDSSTIEDPTALTQHKDYLKKVDEAVEDLAADLTDIL